MAAFETGSPTGQVGKARFPPNPADIAPCDERLLRGTKGRPHRQGRRPPSGVSRPSPACQQRRPRAESSLRHCPGLPVGSKLSPPVFARWFGLDEPPPSIRQHLHCRLRSPEFKPSGYTGSTSRRRGAPGHFADLWRDEVAKLLTRRPFQLGRGCQFIDRHQFHHDVEAAIRKLLSDQGIAWIVDPGYLAVSSNAIGHHAERA